MENNNNENQLPINGSGYFEETITNLDIENIDVSNDGTEEFIRNTHIEQNDDVISNGIDDYFGGEYYENPEI
jgi:hypothetical protein